MNKTRYYELERTRAKLTPEEKVEGWHFCPDWDYMLVGPKMSAMEGCTCKKELPVKETK